jgi:hypothetical protein
VRNVPANWPVSAAVVDRLTIISLGQTVFLAQEPLRAGIRVRWDEDVIQCTVGCRVYAATVLGADNELLQALHHWLKEVERPAGLARKEIGLNIRNERVDAAGRAPPEAEAMCWELARL